MAQRNLSTEKKIMDLENRLAVAKGEGEGVGWRGRMGLIDADYHIWSGSAMRSCWVALRTLSGYSCCNRRKNVNVMYTCKDNLIPLLYSGKIKFKKIFIISPVQFFSTVQHGDPVTHTCMHSFFSHYHLPS